ncbi:MAG TPA: hypothetical protein VI583_11530, partial [Cyclobacteriaceae bacterium]|nr:hypothetical protein [Cyclobacteriaceae bacterium]
SISVEKLFNGDRKLIIDLTAGRGKNTVKPGNANIDLGVFTNDSIRILAELYTGSDGLAELIVEKGYHFPADEDGFITITAEFPGNDSLTSASAEITFKDLTIEIIPEVIDSIKTVALKAYETNLSGAKIPVEGLDITVGVDRLFSLLPVDNIQTDSEGIGTIEFPDDLPGDSLGTLKIIARLEDNEFYGTVSSISEIQWGTKVSYAVEPLPRQLWSNEAPLWMIFSVFIVLSAAWFHFFLAVVKLIKVKKAHEEPIAG